MRAINKETKAQTPKMYVNANAESLSPPLGVRMEAAHPKDKTANPTETSIQPHNGISEEFTKLLSWGRGVILL
jgi:hypothetical protein